jgi:hypothetical protein
MRFAPWFPRFGAALFAITLFASATPAADPKTALEKLPANTEYYASMLRLGETVQTIGKTRLWKMVWEDKIVQEAWKKLLAQYEAGENNWGPIKGLLEAPGNKDWPALAGDAFSNEIFLSLGQDSGDALSLVMEMIGSARYGPILQQALGNPNLDMDKARIRSILQAINEKPERLKLPDMLIGLKVSDPEKVAAQLKRLDDILPVILKGGPLEGRVEKTKLGGDDFQVLKLDGGMVPWNEIENKLEDYEEKANEFKPLLTHLKKQKLHIAVGVRQGYLLIAIGHTTEQVAKFGGAGEKLAGRAEFKPLAKYADKQLTSIAYSSAKLRQAVAPKPEDINGVFDIAKELLKNAAMLPEEQRKAIEKDLEAFAKDLSKGIKAPQGAMDFSFRTTDGWQSFSHDYSEPSATAKKPLSMLNQLGGNPLMAAVWRSGTTAEEYANLVKWLGIFAAHGEKFVESSAPNGDEIIKVYREQAKPLLKELNEIVEKLWLPALADGQEGIVLDGKWTSKQWHAAMPALEKPLPMIEFGLLLGVSDAAKFEKAVEGYRLLVNKVYAKARELNPAGAAPEFEVAKPTVLKVKGVTLAYYAVPEAWGLDALFQPTAGVSDKFAALTLSRGHTERLLKETPLKVASAPLVDPSKSLDGAFYLNWAGIVDVLGPWMEMGANFAPQNENGPNVADYLPKVLGTMKVFRSYSSVTYREGTGTVTHSEAIFGDIPVKK